ncbi:Arylsulfatase A [Neorhodopirellula lusitana]|uniref:Arylsulfatase A n=1 Tax=Neorhodopirellula lusitana TaxID=445327 RepID=A0ABY1QE87_9BACT|nr:sulfatase [Neorhodopirellula lusitana]SMP68999.1 Arylsulfatase A [Neorhodopirellula lusitana]
MLAVGCLLMGAAWGAERPNVLFIAVDDLNTSVSQFHGETTIATPNIGRLAQRGVLFNNAHCAAPACNPSRVSVLSGLAPSSTGVYLNSQDWRENDLLKNWPTIPHHFQANGYKTMGGGKIYHASSLSLERYTGYMDSRPWDEYFPSKQRQMPQEVDPPSVPTNTRSDFYGGRFDWAELDIEPDEMSDAKVVAWASEQLGKTHDQPLFLSVGIYRPHIPWYTPKQYFDRHPVDQVKLPEVLDGDLDDVPDMGKKKLKTPWHQYLVDNDKWVGAVRAYNASVSFTDDMIGRLLDSLDSGPLADNTIVVLWSDHGYHLGQKQHWEKFALWEQTTRVPLIIATPNAGVSKVNIAGAATAGAATAGAATAGAATAGAVTAGVGMAGNRTEQPVSLLDLYPTLIELCGLSTVEKLDGKSLVSLLNDPTQKTGRAVVTTHGYQNHAVRDDHWRYIRYADGSEELYDQVHDPKDFTNLASNPKYKAKKKQLAGWIPQAEAKANPAGNAKRKWKEAERKREARNDNK